MNRIPPWLSWARSIQAIAQSGLFYAENPFELERYGKLERLAVEIFEAYSDAEPEAIAEWFQVQPGYATPKSDVRAACFDERGRILLVRERRDGNWCLPGGWADVGDEPSIAAEREVREESGFTCRATKLIGLFDSNRSPGKAHPAFHAYKMIFLCRITGGEAKPDHVHEIDAVDFFERDALPQLSSPRSTPEQLAECFAHHDDPQRPSYFD